MSGESASATFLSAVLARHTRALSRQEFLKAIRALSSRYVERRALLPERSPLDSAGKRAAFAAFYAPLHFLTTREIVRALGLHRRPIDLVVDLGCGTGAAGAAWAATADRAPHLRGIDTHGWAVDEAGWTWRELGLDGRASRGDLVPTARRLLQPSSRVATDRMGVVLGWSVNELRDNERRTLQAALLELGSRGAAVLVIEPLARRLVPWFDDWARVFVHAGGRADQWRFEVELPPALAELDASAGFRRDALTARSLSIARST